MKKNLIIAVIVVLIAPGNLFSQSKFEGGISIGTGFTYLTGTDYMASEMSAVLTEALEEPFPVSQYDRTFTFTFGGFVAYNVKPWLTFRGGVDFVPKGQIFGGELYLSTNMNMESEILKMNTIMRLSYVEFPVSVQLSTRSKNKPGRVYFYVNMGVAPAALLSAKLDVTTSLVEQSFNNSGVVSDVVASENDVEDLDGIISSDLGVLGSVGIGFSSMAIDLKLTHGMKNVAKYSSDGDLRNNTITLSLWLSF